MNYVKYICLISIFLLSMDGFAQGQITRRPTTQSSSRRTKTTPTAKRVEKSIQRRSGNMTLQTKTQVNYVDLGLSSGTLWKTTNEKGGFYDYDKALRIFGGKLPTIEQWKELQKECTWIWTGSGYNVTGVNGNIIVLPAAGYRGCNGDVNYVESDGGYWSSTPDDSEKAWDLSFDSDGVDIYSDKRCFGQSVRLVQD